MRLSRVFWGGAVRPQAALMGRFRKKTPTAPVAGGGKRQEDEKTKAEKAYSDQLLKSYKNATPKDTRTPEQKAAFKQESLKWSRVVLDAKKVEQAHEQKRLDFMWEAIKLVPEGPLRAHAMTEDPALPSDTMAGVSARCGVTCVKITLSDKKNETTGDADRHWSDLRERG